MEEHQNLLGDKKIVPGRTLCFSEHFHVGLLYLCAAFRRQSTPKEIEYHSRSCIMTKHLKVRLYVLIVSFPSPNFCLIVYFILTLPNSLVSSPLNSRFAQNGSKLA